ncbi:response regulator transcription factor [bacterium]|nr:response regulator transcription factor [bacterium]
MIRLAVIDDHKVVLDGLVNLLNSELEFSVVYSNSNPLTIDFSQLPKIDVWLIDIQMEGIDGIELSKKLLNLTPDYKIIFLTMHRDFGIARMAKDLGAKAYLIKNIDKIELIQSIKSVDEGASLFNLSDLNKSSQIGDLNAKFIINDLTNRELEILQHIVGGLSNQEIGDRLHISPRTVDTHRTNIMRKLQVSNVASLVRVAISNGIKGNI